MTFSAVFPCFLPHRDGTSRSGKQPVHSAKSARSGPIFEKTAGREGDLIPFAYRRAHFRVEPALPNPHAREGESGLRMGRQNLSKEHAR